jgi:hypothetical protein
MYGEIYILEIYIYPIKLKMKATWLMELKEVGLYKKVKMIYS